jgi:hypothetical protein
LVLTRKTPARSINHDAACTHDSGVQACAQAVEHETESLICAHSLDGRPGGHPPDNALPGVAFGPDVWSANHLGDVLRDHGRVRRKSANCEDDFPRINRGASILLFYVHTRHRSGVCMQAVTGRTVEECHVWKPGHKPSQRVNKGCTRPHRMGVHARSAMPNPVCFGRKFQRDADRVRKPVYHARRLVTQGQDQRGISPAMILAENIFRHELR